MSVSALSVCALWSSQYARYETLDSSVNQGYPPHCTHLTYPPYSTYYTYYTYYTHYTHIGSYPRYCLVFFISLS